MTIKENNRIETSNTEKQEKKATWSAPRLMFLEAEDTSGSGKYMNPLGSENPPYGPS